MRLSLRIFIPILALPALIACGCRRPSPKADGTPSAPALDAPEPSDGGATPTPDAPTARAPVKYFVGGDSRDDSAHVVPWAFALAKKSGARAFIFLGDMELTPGLDSNFRNELTQLDPIPFYPVLGNHEVLKLGILRIRTQHELKDFSARFLGTARTPVKSAVDKTMTYSVDLEGGVHFIALDNVSHKGFGAAQLQWLERDLTSARAAASTRHILIGMHKAPAKSGVTKHAMDEDGTAAVTESDEAMAMFEKHKVSMIFASHVHELCSTTMRGIPVWITGGLGAPLVKKPTASDAKAVHHVLELDVWNERLEVVVRTFDGPNAVGGDDDDDAMEK